MRNVVRIEQMLARGGVPVEQAPLAPQWAGGPAFDRRKHIFTMIAAATAAIIFLSGCGGQTTANTTPAEEIGIHWEAATPCESPPSAPSLFDASADIIILHTNDTHGYVKADDDAGVIGFDTIAAIRQSAGENALLLDAGDMSNGHPFAAKSLGLSPIQVMNRIGYDAAAIGNHEFDVPDDNILNVIAAADFPILSANIRREADASYLTRPHKIFTVSNVKIGVFALTTTEAAVNPITSAGLDFGTVESILNDAAVQAEELRAAGCEIVVLLSHLGTTKEHSSVTSIDAADVLGDKVDIIIDGHAHNSPTEDTVENGVPIVSAGGETDSNLGWVTFDKNPDGTFTMRYGYIDFQTARDIFLPDPEITALIDALNKPVEAMAHTVVASTAVDLDGEKGNIRTKETNLGDTLADAARAFTGADIAIMNSGGVRASIQKGEITELEAYTAFPFGDSVYLSEVKGKVIREALEHACSEYPAPEGVFAQVSGLSYTFDPAKPAGSRVVSVEIRGEPLVDDEVYKLATNDFWATGGNGYSMFIEPFQTPLGYDKPQSSIYVMDIFIWYLNETGGAVAQPGGRIRIQE